MIIIQQGEVNKDFTNHDEVVRIVDANFGSVIRYMDELLGRYVPFQAACGLGRSPSN
jgi:hypothetical protein